MKLVVTYPKKMKKIIIVDVFVQQPTNQAVTPDIQKARQVVESVYVDDKIKDYILDLVMPSIASRL